ncbi:MAG: hypothetical protein ABJA71_00520 [Ginsengibacter sp.]
MEIKNIVLIVIFILGLIYMQFLQAKPVDEIINKYAEARGGKEKLNLIDSLHMEGFREMMGNKVTIKVTKVQGKLYRNDFEFGHNKGYTIVTPTAGWAFIPMRSKAVEPIEEERLKAMQADLDIAGHLISYTAKGNKAGLVGKEDVDGKEAYKIKLTLSTGKEIIYLIDTETNLLLQTKQMTASLSKSANENEESEREVVTNFSDYKPVDGIMFPHKISNPGNGHGSGSITFNKIELNKPVDESLYKPSI